MTVSWLTRAFVLGTLAITLPLAARGLYGPPGALINVRWQPSVDATERQRLETEWQLTDGQAVSPDTWRYDLTAPSDSRLRAIVAHAAVADTHNIDRQRSTYWRPRRPGPPDAAARLPSAGRVRLTSLIGWRCSLPCSPGYVCSSGIPCTCCANPSPECGRSVAKAQRLQSRFPDVRWSARRR